jgi:hypothetical protein
MRLFERLFKARSASDRVEPDLLSIGTESIEAKPSATETFEAATERYYERLAAMGIPSPSDWRNPKKKPATTADVDRMYEVNPSFVDLLPGSTTYLAKKPCCWRTECRVLPSLH